jgi:pyruvate,orthophosphate dikinase
MREMILADTEKDRRTALDKLLPMQRADFLELFEIMAGLPVTIRLLDPPLHEFLPKTEEEIAEVAGVLAVPADKLRQRTEELHEFNPMLGHRGCRLAISYPEIAEVASAMNVPADKLRQRTEALHEFNPMLGHRGCRLAVSYPEIAEMQARAIFEAAVEAGRKAGALVVPEIMVPLVGIEKEFAYVKARIDAVAKSVMEETGVHIDYLTGTMIELPRAAIRADIIAATAEFFSFGTNDLTQTTFGISRDDAASFLETYRQKGIVEQDPFVSIDVEGVGELVRMAAGKGRQVRPEIKLGICGEHGGDPASIHFCEDVGLDYVSCSPYRVPIARLAAAQAAVKKQ